MVKIKKIKSLTESEYLHYLIDNTTLNGICREFDYRNGSEKPNAEVTLTLSDIGNATEVVDYTDTYYQIECEEEITEHTVIPFLIERRDFGNELIYSRYKNVRITDLKGNESTAFYMEDRSDLSLKLIWRNGGLVES